MTNSNIGIVPWQERRKTANKLYKYVYTDQNLDYQFDDNNQDQHLIDTVIDYFNNGSELVYPEKYIFCNIVYSYYLNKYFGLDFYKMLDSALTIPDSPMYYYYSDNKFVYDQILKQILPKIESFQSIVKTRHYFKQEFSINDEDISDVDPFVVK